jgi:hypothetical protein
LDVGTPSGLELSLRAVATPAPSPAAVLQVAVNLKSSPTDDASTLVTIGEVSRRSGVAASALRFYEQRGLITSERAGSGHRYFRRSVIRRIAFIVFAQRLGLSLAEIGRELDKLPPDRVPSRRDWTKLSQAWSGCDV